MATRVIDAILRMKDDGFTKTFKESIGYMTQFGREGKAVRKTIAKQGEAMVGIGKAMTAAVTAPVIGLGAAAYKSFESVDKQMNLVKATMGDTAFATADLSKELSSAMTKSIFSMEEGASALVNYARQGWNAKQAADMLSPALNIAAGTATDLSEVTSGLGNTLKAFGADASEATHYADMFTKAQAQANTSVSGLFEAMSVAGPIAKTVGWDFEDIATLVGVFGDMSIEASEGANALKTGLSRLSGGNSTANKALDALGISLYNDAGQMKSMVDVIGTLQGAFNGMTQEEQMFYASQLFGSNQMSKWLALINGPGVESLQELRDNISGASGNAQAAADAMMTPLEKLSSTFDVFKYTVGETIADAVVPCIEKLTKLVDTFRQMAPEQREQIVRWVGIAAAIGPALIVVGKLTIGFSKLLGAMSVIGKAGGIVQAALGGLAATPVIAGIAAVIGVVALLATHWDKAKETMSQFQWIFDSLGKNFEEFKTNMAPVISALGEFGAAVLDCFGDTLATAVGGAISLFAGFLSMVLATVNGVIYLVNRMKEQIHGAFEAIANSPVGRAASAIAGIAGAAAGAVARGASTVAHNAAGTSNWRGGLTMVHEKGGEIMDLPQGTRIYPAERTANMMRSAGVTISIPKLADQIVIREDADIDKLGDVFVRKLALASGNMGGLNGSLA